LNLSLLRDAVARNEGLGELEDTAGFLGLTARPTKAHFA
jgi:hypothetical protein